MEKTRHFVVAFVAVLILASLMLASLMLAWNFFGSKKTSPVAIAVLAVERPEGMVTEEYENYRTAQRKTIVSDFVLSEAAEDPLIARTKYISRQKDPVSALRKGLKDITGEDDHETIVLTFSCPDENEAVTILDEIIDEYMTNVVIEARVQREGLLEGVQRTHERITRSLERLKQVEGVLRDPQFDSGLSLSELRELLEKQLAKETDPVRANNIQLTLSYLDDRTQDSEIKKNLGELLEYVDHRRERFEARIEQIGADLKEWLSYQVPVVKVQQHAKIVGDQPD